MLEEDRHINVMFVCMRKEGRSFLLTVKSDRLTHCTYTNSIFEEYRNKKGRFLELYVVALFSELY